MGDRSGRSGLSRSLAYQGLERLAGAWENGVEKQCSVMGGGRKNSSEGQIRKDRGRGEPDFGM